MVTGDHPETAATVAAAVGMAPGATLTGADVDGLDAVALRRAAAEVAVFARVAPAHKVRIVEALAANGHVVAMTGDGVNDAPALKRAAVGIAMGQRGSDVSREVADLVLLDDDFTTIVAAIEEGRTIYENIQTFIRFLFSTNLAEVIVISLGALLAFALGLRDAAGAVLVPLTAAQLLWINLVTDGAPALALGLDRHPGVMRAPPRDPRSPLLDRRSLRFVAMAGVGSAAMALGLLGVLPRLGEPLVATRTAAFSFLALVQLVLTYPARRATGRPLPNPWLRWTVAASVVAQVAAWSVPGVERTFDLARPSAGALVAVALAVVAAWALAEAGARWIWRRTAA
jgi:Ca2+-transporting ATPase